MSKPTLIDFLNALTVSGENLLIDEEAEKAYTPFIINRGIAQTIDGVLFANEMNKLPGITKQMHYGYLNRSLIKKKRYAKWPKKLAMDEHLEIVSNYYNVSIEEAQTYLEILTPDQINEIKAKMDTGGTGKKRAQKG
ncbi:hypothetical protein [Ralstonia phage RSP15]|uniref:clamp loader of DNA polymerase n=1 Tax=Ralstonia phage RSP15 TaxID=1785960 RepID=UPI00074D2D9C|nr:clamp loader of DNA polymerase [Ralstonia phage RSP15]BAU40089.1 hypothetical protein [Ralstonia phage RSP15]